MVALLQRHWYLIVGVVLGVASLSLWRNLWPAWRSARAGPSTANARLGRIFASALLGLCAGALAMPYLGERGLLVVVFSLMVVCIILGWVLLLSSGAVRYAGLFNLMGPVEPVPENMVKPVASNFALLALAFFAGSIGGIVLRIFVLVRNVA